MVKWSKLTKGTDGGGVRYHLDDRPIETGTVLLLRLPSTNERCRLAEALEGRAARASQWERDILCQAAELLRAPVAWVGFELHHGEPRFGLLTGTNPYVEDGFGERRPTYPGAPGAIWDGAVVACLGDRWRALHLCWPDQHPEASEGSR